MGSSFDEKYETPQELFTGLVVNQSRPVDFGFLIIPLDTEAVAAIPETNPSGVVLRMPHVPTRKMLVVHAALRGPLAREPHWKPAEPGEQAIEICDASREPRLIVRAIAR